jgi:peptidoglycan/LPS O-acetylase OafA/YrhL
MPQSWYLAADFQCHFVSMLLLIVVWKHRWCAKAMLTGVLFVSIVISFVQTYIEGLDPVILLFPE